MRAEMRADLMRERGGVEISTDQRRVLVQASRNANYSMWHFMHTKDSFVNTLISNEPRFRTTQEFRT